MRRWNGWGDDSIQAHLAPEALDFLQQQLGQPKRPQDASLEAVCAQIERDQPSRFGGALAHPLIDIRPEARLRSSYGQSLGDWIQLRFGQVARVSDGVAFPESRAQVRELLDWAAAHNVLVIPCGGATSVVGHLLAPAGETRPVLTLNLTRLRALTDLNREAQLATFEAGVLGPDLEAQLRAHGFTLGHFPQSFEYASLGGWVVTRSSGQQSLRYGRAENWFAGGTLLTPGAELNIPPLPASAAGPDLREWVLGSEGRFGVLTDVTVRVTRLPEEERFIGIFLPSWDAGLAAVRELAQTKTPLSMMRLANAVETLTTLKLAGHAGQIAWLERYLGWRGCGEGKVLLFIGLTGSRAQVANAQAEALGIVRQFGGVSTGQMLGKKWAAKRFAGVYLRNALWEAGYMVDTMETAIPWGGTTAMVNAIENAGREALAGFGERCHAYTHLSHVYSSGSSVYSTFVFRLGATAEESHARWWALKTAICKAMVAQGGTISHQHGVGKDHAPYLGVEKGAAGLAAIDAAIQHFDPKGVLASGNLR
ncbi:alkyldihydroxyacetonephosphate synthase [Inhella inkyongensis]|uniref:Alkyldihydroxyacetonephosphate synthase n=1 Tax=Inhella inkyongensis TaxID=392593 RepID=A0A840RW06_9BURK|nr:FAD-binding oxidoreductase [Inhella inkyongensis]MBB5202857.1 alkyldihydroxyacetonephosphate synthase [Inhella inkyongensis]